MSDLEKQISEIAALIRQVKDRRDDEEKTKEKSDEREAAAERNVMRTILGMDRPPTMPAAEETFVAAAIARQGFPQAHEGALEYRTRLARAAIAELDRVRRMQRTEPRQ